MMIRQLLPLLLSLWISIAVADINEDLNSFFNGLGMTSNVTQASAYHGQQAGYYTGGRVFARQRVRNLQLATISLPKYRSGCGGIDLFMGGFSFVNKEAIVQMARNIINNAKGYAFNLALETVTPQIANGMKYFQKLANEVNQSNINSCESAAALVGGLWPKTKVAQNHVCKDIGTSNNAFTDWAAARQGCGAGGEMEARMDEARSNEQYKHMIVDNTNIVWHALKENPFLSSDKSLAELFMSLSGTVIYKRNDDGTLSKPIFPSLATDKSLLNALLNGGTTEIYDCDEDDKCLAPTKKNTTIAPDKALENKIREILTNITNKIFSDEALTTPEQAFLQSTSLPIYKLLNVQAAFAHDKSILDVGQYAEMIASDILFQYLMENLRIVKNSVEILEISEEQKKSLLDGIQVAINQLRQEQKKVYQRLHAQIDLIQKTQLLERMLAGQLSSRVSNSIEWARGL